MKAILVIDEMPNQCVECPCFREGDEYVMDFCKATYKPFESIEKPSWCPLKPMPTEKEGLELMDFIRESDFQTGYRGGWNDCLKEIEK